MFNSLINKITHKFSSFSDEGLQKTENKKTQNKNHIIKSDRLNEVIKKKKTAKK